MAWETRGNRRYYYMAHREGNRVVKEYVHPTVAKEIAMLLEDGRHTKADALAERREAIAKIDALGAVLEPLNAVADAVADGAMLAAGYHRHHRGAWRKRRNGY